MSAETPLSAKAGALKQAFDRSFSQARRVRRQAFDDLVAVRVRADPYAIRLSQIAGLFAKRPITPLPGPIHALIGIASVRGGLLSVYDLGVLLGHAAVAAPQWLVVSATAPVAFAFDGFEGYLRVSHDTIASRDANGYPARPFVREVAGTPDRVRPIVHLPSVLEAIARQLPPEAAGKER